MKKFKIVTDSSAELGPDEIKELAIHVLPLTVMIDDVVYVDGVTLQKEEFMEKMQQAKALPKTSQPPIGQFVELYDELGKDGSEVISIHMTENLSGTVNTARQAAQLSTTEVTVIDSDFTDRGLSFQVIEAARMALANADKEAILKRIDEVRANTKLYICVVTLENLVKGGRIGRLAGALSSFLNVKVMMEQVKGQLELRVRGRGMKPVNKWLVELQEKLKETPNIREVSFSYADDEEACEEIKNKFQAALPDVPMRVRLTSPIISTHAGKGAFAVMYYTD
ncbi:fatty acid-binding protein DegV [Carnobacterium divergens]|uniref:DegV family protein n=1 Tax=Carnobacterium divergens TaxID=2748 RepID=UPI001071945F|nr:DegV family protein [Carnobacterium divergens]TFJ38614.1 fatty acid-binding protein DegV [Carnobacterium divergens]TFJ47848.1 fatty acid-binding protein DegV [Carnobacterium divergens]TFJ52812.1 fatty acid-binding protein DegV [Carnobacterium divergens]TFJ58537.1 fatty acid-binding protein DegV [Carnobacterium divergens]TFJ68602.1 fatty acid-binding protein DegV [Carnobacterium divergens]